jgi:serine/threonine protein kinase
MSPELLGEEGASFTTDVWSVGITLYEMLCGRPPFFSGTIKKTIELICNEPLKPLCEANPEVPKPLSDLVGKALEKEPGRRHASATLMLQELKRFEQTANSRVEEEVAALRDLLGPSGDTAQAEAKLLEIVSRYPNDPRGYLHLGELYGRCQLPSQAVEAFQKGLWLDPQHGLLNYRLGMVYQGLQERAEAAECFRKALAGGLEGRFKSSAQAFLKMLGVN